MATVVEEHLSVREDFERQHNKVVREEIETFRIKADAFTS